MSEYKDKEITVGALADAYRQCIAHMKVGILYCILCLTLQIDVERVTNRYRGISALFSL